MAVEVRSPVIRAADRGRWRLRTIARIDTVRVRPGTVIGAWLVVSCLAMLGACVRAPVMSQATPIEKNSAPQPVEAVEERILSVDDIRSELWPRERLVRFQPSTLRERQVASAIVEALLSGAEGADAPLSQLAHQAKGIGHRVQIWRVDDQRYWALVEAPESRRGAGAYIVRVGARPAQEPSVLLQAPHAYYDLGTGVLALRLFFADNRRVVGLFVNTLHRYWDESGDYQRRERSPADVCHRTDHVFQHATASAMRASIRLVVIQLHGFADGERRPDAIISSGDTSQSAPVVARLADSLKPLVGKVLRFPEETDELGGTTNAQGRLLSTSRRAHFVHLELSSRVRRALRKSPKKLSDMARVLFGSALDGPDESSGPSR